MTTEIIVSVDRDKDRDEVIQDLNRAGINSVRKAGYTCLIFDLEEIGVQSVDKNHSDVETLE